MLEKFIRARRAQILGVIVALGFGLRLWRLDYPLMDWHSFRQADTASVTREFVRHHYPIWRPHYHDLGSVQSGQDNLAGDRMVEFPLVNYCIALILQIFSSWSLVSFSRLAAAICSSGSVICVYWLVKRMMDKDEDHCEIIALSAAAAMALLPYSIFYGRAILPEPFQVFLGLVSLVSFSFYLEKKTWQGWLITCLSLMAALLVKPTTVFWGPLWIFLAWRHDGKKCLQSWDLWLLAIVSVLPLCWWRLYIQQFPAGIPASDWLLNGPLHGTPPRWRPMWWRWLFYERLGKLWLGGFGSIFALWGLWPSGRAETKKLFSAFDGFTYLWLGCDFVYLSTFATGNIQHDYYQYLLLPSVCILCGRGLAKAMVYLQSLSKKADKKVFFWCATVGLAVLVGCGWYVSWRQVKGFFDINDWRPVYIGQVAARMLPLDALVIAHAFDGDTNFLFQTERTGWPSGLDLEEKIANGAQFFVGTNTDDLYHYLDEHFLKMYQDENGFIFDLQASRAAQINVERNE